MFRKNGRASRVLFTEADVRTIQESLADFIFFSMPGNTMIIGILITSSSMPRILTLLSRFSRWSPTNSNAVASLRDGGRPASMSKLGESLAIVEVDLDFEKADWAEEATHIELRAITEMMHQEKLVFPVYAASLAPNGTGCLYLFANHDSSEGHVVAVHEPKGMGAPFPIHYLLMDAEGRTARIIIQERTGS
jgi:hypothetical protein